MGGKPNTSPASRSSERAERPIASAKAVTVSGLAVEQRAVHRVDTHFVPRRAGEQGHHMRVDRGRLFHDVAVRIEHAPERAQRGKGRVGLDVAMAVGMRIGGRIDEARPARGQQADSQ